MTITKIKTMAIRGETPETLPVDQARPAIGAPAEEAILLVPPATRPSLRSNSRAFPTAALRVMVNVAIPRQRNIGPLLKQRN